MRKNFMSLFCFSVFKRWKSSNYAVFSSMGKILKIGTLMVVYLQFANPKIANCSENDSIYKKFNLESIDVNTKQLPEAYSSVSRVVRTIDKIEIERAAVTSVNELLEYASNIDIRQRGVGGSQADVTIRGGSFDQVLILLNGINITDPQTGHHNLNLPIDLSAIERVEILKGSGSWKFGPGAFTGAINFITSKPSENQLAVAAEYGQFNYNAEKLTGSFNLGKSNHLLSINRNQSDGYIENTDYLIQNFFYRGAFLSGSNELSLQAGYTVKEFGSNSFYTPKYPDQFEATHTSFASVGIKTGTQGIDLEPKLYFRRNHDRFELFRHEAPSWYKTHNYHTTDVLGINVLSNINLIPNHSTTVGFDVRNETIWSNVLGTLNDQPVASPKYDSIQLTHFQSRTIGSGYVGHKFVWGRLNTQAAINLTRVTDLDFKWFTYPAIDLSFELTSHASVFASGSKTMRLPTFTDLFYKGPTNLGNPNLKPEEATSYEAGLKWNNAMVESSLSSFYRRGENLIDWVRLPNESIWQSTNHTLIHTFGIELHSKFDFTKLEKDNPFVRSIQLDYTYIDQSKESGEKLSYYAMDYLKHRLDFGVEHRIVGSLSANWHVSMQDRNGTYTEFVNGSFGNETNYKPFALLDLKIQWKHNSWIAFVSSNNLLATKYFDISNVEQPGSWFRMGISKKFKF
jgi:vitamin B12 transporter